MFDLAYPLQTSVEVDGVEYEVDLSFDNVLRLFDLLSDEELTDTIQIDIGLRMLLGDEIQIEGDIYQKEELFYQIFTQTIGKEAEQSAPVDIAGNPMPDDPKTEERSYDLKQDAEYIYASFMSDYNIDLFEQQGKLHWDKFKALLGGLTDGSKFLRVLEIRTMELPKGKGTEKERAQIKKLKEQYALK